MDTIKMRTKLRTDIDFVGHVLQKLLISLDPEKLNPLLESLKRRGIDLKIQHASCPHKEDAEK